MAEIKIAAVLRAGIYSPNHIGNDAAILNLVADQLRKRGCEVNMYSEEQLAAGAVSEDTIINMCREPRSIEWLQRAEDSGRLVINSGYGIENCIRERLTRILVGSNIPYPDSMVVDTDTAVREKLAKAGISQCWIKRGDKHTQHKEDVSYVRRAEEAQELVQEYFLRGIPRAVIQRHLEGELVQFYGVCGIPFFFWFFPMHPATTHPATETRLSIEPRLKEMAQHAASELNIQVYGGECILSPDGDLRIIDFNDWPSFAPCRVQASTAIAKSVIGEIKNRK
ncbi:MAG: hypothetical protein OSJ26_04975 [Muribaculaceae bacterium]|jgi:hypothetical protein|nr:hypothetical protein [Muribaculaceae bacterium]HUN20888.1 hypothetical protein [Muribaculaceae bacterium]